MTSQLALDPPVEATPCQAIGIDWCRVPDSMLGILRDYQLELLDHTRAAFEAHSRVLVQLPTGGGKTHVLTAITCAAERAGLRTLVLATRTRLVKQISDRLNSFSIPHGIIAAAIPEGRWNAAAVQVASVDTVYRRAIVDQRMPMPPADLVIFDEAHLALGDSRVAILERYPAALHLGLTATPAKISGRPLADRFDALVMGPTVRELVAGEALVPLRIFSSPVLSADELASIGKDSKSGDYVISELASVMSKPKLVGDALANWRRIANGKRTIIFACNKSHGAALLEDFLRDGVASELVTDETSEEERGAMIARLEWGDTTVLINCVLMSYGVDIPALECIVLARPTRSVVLYLQCVGRGMRPTSGKKHCIVIDHGRVVETLGLPHGDFEWSLGAGSNVNRTARQTSTRRHCGTLEQPRTCPECTHIWLVSEEGPACCLCGWAPAPRAKAITASDVQLREIGVGEEKSAEVDVFYCEALGFYKERWPERWESREKSARWACWMWAKEALGLTRERPPSWYWSAEPLPCSPEIQGKLKSRLIAFARVKAGECG